MKINYFLGVLICGIFLILWSLKSSSIFIIQNNSKQNISEVIVNGRSKLVWKGSINSSNSKLLIVNKKGDYGLDVSLLFSNEKSFNEKVGYLVSGDIFLGRHYLIVDESNALSYRYKTYF